MLSGRICSQLAEVALRDAQATLDPRHTDDDCEGAPPVREITLVDVEESRRLVLIAESLQIQGMMLGFSSDDPFESDAEIELRRCDEWERVLP